MNARPERRIRALGAPAPAPQPPAGPPRPSAAGLVFHSVLGTLNHIMLADILWYMRITGKHEVGKWTHDSVAACWSQDPSRWSSATANLDETREELLAQCDRWEELIAETRSKPQALLEPFEYKNTRGEPMTKPLGPVIQHVFNHSAHHRGQVSAGITRLGRPAPVLDLLYFLDAQS